MTVTYFIIVIFILSCSMAFVLVALEKESERDVLKEYCKRVHKENWKHWYVWKKSRNHYKLPLVINRKNRQEEPWPK